MKNKPFFLPIAVLITTITLGISVPAFFLANRAGLANFSEVNATSTPPPSVSLKAPPARDTGLGNTQNCTYHAFHWLSHPDAWPVQVTLGGVTYTKADMLNVGNAPEGDVAIDLLKETLIAIVNIYNGASQARIENTLVEADKWLKNHQADDDLSEFNQQQAHAFTLILADYNNGRLFPAACSDQIPLPAVELASEEDTLQSLPPAPTSQAGNSYIEANQSDRNTNTVDDLPPQNLTPEPTKLPPARSPVQRPIDTPIAPAPPQIVVPGDPPGKPVNDNPGRANPKDNQGQGNGNGNDNPGRGKDNPGRGNDDPNAGNQSGGGGNGNDNPGRGNDNPGRGNDNPGRGNQGRGDNIPGLSDQATVNDQPSQSSSGRNGEDNPGKDKDNSGKDKGKGDSGKDKDQSSHGKGNSSKGNDKKRP
jgi:hypothetical protein